MDGSSSVSGIKDSTTKWYYNQAGSSYAATTYFCAHTNNRDGINDGDKANVRVEKHASPPKYCSAIIYPKKSIQGLKNALLHCKILQWGSFDLMPSKPH